MEIKIKNPVLQAVLGILVIGIAAGWYFYDREKTKAESYKGEIVERYDRQHLVSSGSSKHKKRKRTYYIVVSTESGDRKEVKVPLHIYSGLHTGDLVEKIEGEMYPKKTGNKYNLDQMLE